MPPRGSKLQRQKSASDQQLNNDDQAHLSEPNQKSDPEIQSSSKQADGTDSDDAQQIAAIEIQKQQDALMMVSQPNFNISLNDQEEKSKDFLDARSKVQDVDIDDIVKMILKREITKNQERILLNLHKFQNSFDENGAIQILNILIFLKECLPFFKSCPFFSRKKIELFSSEISKLLNSNENEEFFQNYFLNVSSFCSDFDNLFSFQYNCKYFQNHFKQIFSKLSTNLVSSIQRISNGEENQELSIEVQNLNESLKVLYINVKILMATKCIRTAISIIGKLIKLKSDFHRFLCITRLISDDTMVKLIDQFDILVKLALHLKMIFIIHQLIEILDQISSRIIDKKRPPLKNNEIAEYMEDQKSADSEMRKILDEFSFEIKDKTDFLALANEFIQQLNNDMTIDNFKSILLELLSKSYSLLSKSFHQCGLKPVFFSLHYHYRMIQAATSSIIPLLRSESFDQTEYIQKYYISLKKILKKFSLLEGKNVDLGIINDLSFSLIMQIKDPCHDVKPKSSYKGTAAFQNVYKYIKLCLKDLEIIESTICFTHQIDFFLKEFKVIDEESCFNLDCQFYSHPENSYFNKFQSIQIQDDHQYSQTDNYDAIINEISFQLHSHGYNMLPSNYSQSTFCDISAPNISNAIKIMLNYGDVLQIRKLIENPDQLGNEENLFLLINDIYKRVVDNPQSKYHLKESLSVYLDTYFLLRALSLAGKINFSNSVHLMYFRTFASIIFNDEFIGKISLLSSFDPSAHPCYHSILKRLTSLKGMKQINDEISHVRLFYFKFADAVFQIDPSIIKSNIDILTRIFEWFSNPTNESNEKFLTFQYLTPVRELKNLFAEIIRNTKRTLNRQASIYKALREIEAILNIINNIQIHYIQYRKIEIIIPYLRSFFSCEEDDKKKLYQFVSYFPVWLNSVHRCFNYGLIHGDESLLEKSFKSTTTNVTENCEQLINSFDVQYLSFFNDLITCSLKAYDQRISMIIDVIVRGSFSFENISRLFSYLLNYFVSLSDSFPPEPKYQLFMTSLNYDLWRNAIKLSCFLIALNTHPYLHRKLDLNILRIINMKNYVNSYINGFLYLQNSVLSSSFDKESSRNILSTIKELQKLVSDLPICVRISETYFQIKQITSIMMAINNYLCEIGPEEGIKGRIESFIRNIQDRKIRDAFESSFRVALLSGTNSQGSTTLLSKEPTGTPVLASQSAVANGYEPIFYNKYEENYLDDLTDVLSEYLDADEELKAFLQRNNSSYANSNYFNDNEDINPNIVSCSLHKKLIEECFNDEERKVENYVKAIDMINILSLYLSIIKETSSFQSFAYFKFTSYVRLAPPFAIYKPPNWDKSDISKSFLIDANNQSKSENQQEERTTVDNDWLMNDYELYNSCIDDHFEFSRDTNSYCPTELSIKIRTDENASKNNHSIQAKNQAQLQLLPFQYVFDDTGISSTKFRLKNLFNNAQQALKTEIPTPMPSSDFNSEQLLPQPIQQQLVDKIQYVIKGIKPDFLDEQKDNQSKKSNEFIIFDVNPKEKEQRQIQKDPLLIPNIIIKGNERSIKKSGKGDGIYPYSGESDNEEEDYKDSQNDFNQPDQQENRRNDEDDNDFDDDDYTPTEMLDPNQEKRGESIKVRGRGRPPRRRDRRTGRGGKAPERTNSSPTSNISLQLSSSANLGSVSTKFKQTETIPTNGKISFLKSKMAKLSQLENEEAKMREYKENVSRVPPLVSSTILQIGNDLKHLSKSSTENAEKKNEYLEAIIDRDSEINSFLIKKEQLKQSQNEGKGLNLSNSVAQKVIDSSIEHQQTINKEEEKIKVGFGLFNPFNLFPPKKSTHSIDLSSSPPPIEENEEQRKEVVFVEQPELTSSELRLLHQKQIENIAQNKIKQNQQRTQEEENSNQFNFNETDQDSISLNQKRKDQTEEIEEQSQEQAQEDLSETMNQQQQSKNNLISLEEIYNNTKLRAELQHNDQEKPNYTSPLQNLTRKRWTCFSNEEIENNSLSDDFNQNMSHFIFNADEFDENENRLNEASNQKSYLMLHESPEDLQQRFNLVNRRIQSCKDIAGDKTKSSSNSNKKSNRTSVDKIKIDVDSNTKNKINENNDGQVLSDADPDMAGDSDVGFGLDDDF